MRQQRDFCCCHAVSNTKDNPPCNTLFVGNLGDTVSEAELRQLFGTLAGFRQLKLIRGARSVTCFVEFNDLPSAMACHQNQQVQLVRVAFLYGAKCTFAAHFCTWFAMTPAVQACACMRDMQLLDHHMCSLAGCCAHLVGQRRHSDPVLPQPIWQETGLRWQLHQHTNSGNIHCTLI